MKRKCIFCHHPVGHGSDRHAKNTCPPVPGIYGERRELKMLRKKKAKKAETASKRGVAVAGTGVPKGGGGVGKRAKALAEPATTK